jgi:uncharacterized membrane protein
VATERTVESASIATTQSVRSSRRERNGVGMLFGDIIETIGKVIDAVGVAVIVIGALAAAVLTAFRMREGDAYRRFRQQLGRSILLGLELLVAADIIRTVAVTPTLESVGVLAGIVVIRTFLSWSLELEITGAWPWQKRAATAQPGQTAQPAEAAQPVQAARASRTGGNDGDPDPRS